MSWLGSWSISHCSSRDRPASTGHAKGRVEDYRHLKTLALTGDIASNVGIMGNRWLG